MGQGGVGLMYVIASGKGAICQTRSKSPSAGASALRIMPSGHRGPYRFGAGSPSPCHTSDSEETWHHKKRYTFLARTYTRKWRRHVAWRKRPRRLKNLLCRKNPSPEVLEMIAAFLVWAAAFIDFRIYGFLVRSKIVEAEPRVIFVGFFNKDCMMGIICGGARGLLRDTYAC